MYTLLTVYHIVPPSPCLTLASCQTCSDQSGVEFAALVNFIASVLSTTVANFREKRTIKNKEKKEKSCSKG